MAVSPAESAPRSDSSADLTLLREGLERCTRSLNVGILTLGIWSLLMLLFPFIIADLVASNDVPSPIFWAGVWSAILSLFYLAVFWGAVASVGLWSRAESLLSGDPRYSSVDRGTLPRGARAALGFGVIGLGVVSLAALIFAGLHSHDSAAYGPLLDLASGLILLTLALSSLFLSLAAEACVRTLRLDPRNDVERTTRIERRIRSTAGFAVVPGAVFLLGSVTDWISWELAMVAVIGAATPLGAIVGFVDSRSALVAWRERLQASATSLAAPSPGTAAPIAAPAPSRPQETLPSSTDPIEFDLRVLHEESARAMRSTRVRTVVLCLTAYAFALGLVVLIGVPSARDLGSALFVLVPLISIGTLGLALVLRSSPGLLALRLDPDGVRCRLDDGQTWTWFWSSPSGGLVLRDYAPTPTNPSGIPGPRYWLQAEGTSGFFGAVSDAAASALVSSARGHGLLLQSAEGWSTARGGTKSLNLRITAGAPRTSAPGDGR